MLRNREDILQILSDAVSEGIIVVDEHQNIVSANTSANAMFGYDGNELVGMTLSTLIPSEYHHRHEGHFKEFYKHSEKRSMGHGRNLYGLTKSNLRFPVEVGLNPFTLYGKPLVMALVVDITERRAIEENLNLRSEALQSAGNGIVICDALKKDYPIIYFNPAFQALTGYTSEEIVGSNCRFLQVDDQDQEGLATVRAAIKNGNSCQVILRNYKKDGTLFWNELYINPIRDKSGLVTHFIGIQNDITQRKKAEEERNYLTKIFDDSLNEIFVFDADSLKFLNVNYGAQKNLGYSLETLKTMTPVDIKPNFSEDEFKALLISLINDSGDKMEFETVHERKDGTLYPVHVTLELSILGDREVFISIVLDITEQKNYTRKLEETVELRTKQLEMALEKEKELNELKTKFLSLVSHEFKTPLSGILTSSMLLSKYTLEEQQANRDKHIKIIEDKVNYLNTILNDFLSIERLETGKVNYKFSTFRLSKVLNEVVYNANMLLKEGQQIKYPDNIDDITLIQDEKTIELALSNLVHNAIKYSPEHSDITIKITQNSQDTIFEISDTGIGIPEKDQKNIFNRYFRSENVLTTQGTGIGLNIVKSHIENLGGSISFKSKEHVGSTFILTIPNKSQ
ncbi:PAS domain-containing sensor histidine kinase [Gelidibacter pelagius]|uniref:histidine kinase n=1 Tax=Gelidibacter pelagius TaxID=2819985 RepID=A0ABS3STA0_9FLAO|nr:PAS domain-containing sensor histidine kinase [Gelidibacter pelagius]MBO3098940.1 PAS domain S-box protein [Gelidibacter pelagius]